MPPINKYTKNLKFYAKKELFIAARDKKLTKFKLYLHIVDDVNDFQYGVNTLWWIVKHYAGTPYGDILVWRLIKLGAQVNLQYGTPLLKLAALAGDIAIVKRLITAKAPVTSCALEAAVTAGKLEIVQAFIAAKATVTEDALKLAIIADNLEMVQTLIAANGAVTKQIILTAIRSESPNVEIIKLLINNYVDIETSPTTVYAIMPCAAAYIKSVAVRYQVIDLLRLAGIKIDSPLSSTDARTALYIAAQNGDLRSMDYYIQHGANVNVTYDGKNLLWWLANTWRARTDFFDPEETAAVYKTCLHLAEVLIAKGVDVNMGAETILNTPLLLAVRSKNIALAELFVKHGANVNVTSTEASGATPLWFALFNKHREFSRTLIELNADVNVIARVSFSATPLCLAVGLGDLALINLLLTLRASPGKGDCFSPLLYAVRINRIDIVELLLNDLSSRDQKVKDFYFTDNLLESAVSKILYNTSYDMIKLLIMQGANVNSTANIYDANKHRLIAIPFVEWVTNRLETFIDTKKLITEDREILMLLLEKKLDPNTKIKNGSQSLLQWAWTWGLHVGMDLFVLLLEHGADPNTKIDDIPIIRLATLAARTRNHANSYQHIIHFLIKKGADPNTMVGHGGSLLQWSVAHADEQLMYMLIDKGADPNTYITTVIASRTVCRPILIWAINTEKFDFAVKLVAKGVDLDAFMQEICMQRKYALFIMLNQMQDAHAKALKEIYKHFKEEPANVICHIYKYLDNIPKMLTLMNEETRSNAEKDSPSLQKLRVQSLSDTMQNPHEFQDIRNSFRQQQKQAEGHAAKVVYCNILKHPNVSKLPDPEKERLFVASFLPVFQKDINIGVARDQQLRKLLYAQVAKMTLFCADVNDSALTKDRFEVLFQSSHAEARASKEQAAAQEAEYASLRYLC